MALLGALGLAVTGCDNVDESDRLIDYPLPAAAKNELIMEFTGQRCSNCPDGAKVIHELQESYPENIIAVCLHPTGPEYTMPLGRDLGLRSQTATELYSYYNPPSFPFAVFDGEVYDQSRFYLQWSERATELVKGDTPVTLDVEATYDADRHITVNVSADFVRGEYGRPLNIAVWIMENGIVGMQTSTTGRLNDYTHNHVLRTSLNGTWGVEFGSSFSFGEQKEYSVSLENPADSWILENCQVVAFLCDPSSKKVIQAAVTDLEEN